MSSFKRNYSRVRERPVNPKNVKKVYATEHSYNTTCWWFLWIIIILVFIGLFVAISVPNDYSYHYYHTLTANLLSNIRGPRDCTSSESYNVDLRLCAPKSDEKGVSLEMFDYDIDKCQSFYHHTCGSWIRNHTNEDRAFTYVYRKNKKQTQEIIMDASLQNPAYLFYRSCLDTLVHGMHVDKTEAEIRHLKEHIIEPFKSIADLAVTFGKMAQYGFTVPFQLEIESHPTQPKMIPLIQKDTLILGEFDSLIDMIQVESVQSKLNSFYQYELDYPQSYEQYILSGQFDLDIRQLNKTHSTFWRQFFMQLGGPGFEHDLLFEKDFWIPKLDYHYLNAFLNSINEIEYDDWKSYIEYSILYHTKEYMPQLHTDSYFRIHNVKHHTERLKQTMSRKRALETPTETHCITLTNQLLPGYVAEQYLTKYMPHAEQTRRTVTSMVERIRDEYVKIIQNTDWMTNETKELAAKKIQNIIIRAVHPNTWETEPFLERIDKQRYVHNLNMVRKYRIMRNIELYSLYKEPSGRDSIQRFGAPLTTVNAYYSPITNTITVFAGILTDPFYRIDMDDVSLHATVGMIVGHELSHAMDNSGRKFDSDGSFNPLYWAQTDIDTFHQKTRCIVKEYGPPQGCENANYGQQTLGEDIADITGITLSYNALLTKHPSLTIADKKRFFTIFSQMWAESFDQQHVCARVDGDVHAVAWFRVDKTLRQLKEFGQVFDCKVGTEMMQEKDDRCVIYGEK